MLLAIDPGPERSAYVTLDDYGHIITKGIVPNAHMHTGATLPGIIGVAIEHFYYAFYYAKHAVIEMPQARGQRVGNEVLETCRWVGRFEEAWNTRCAPGREMHRIARREVVQHFCGINPKGADSAVRQCLLDRYGPGKQTAIGTKKRPGPLYGIKLDEWQALALGCYLLDRFAQEKKEKMYGDHTH